MVKKNYLNMVIPQFKLLEAKEQDGEEPLKKAASVKRGGGDAVVTLPYDAVTMQTPQFYLIYVMG